MPKTPVAAESPAKWREWVETLYFTDETTAKRFVRNALKQTWSPEEEIDVLSQLQLLALDWLSQYQSISDAQRQDIVQRVTACLQVFVRDVAQVTDGKFPVFKLVIGDYRWVSCTFRDTHYDMEEGVETDELPHAAVTYWVCDLTALYLRACLRLERLHRASHAPQHGSETR